MKNAMKLLTLVAFLSMWSLSSFAVDGGSSSTGIKNPASELCVSIGGKVLIEKDPAGERGLCVIGEWSLLRAMIQADVPVAKPVHHDGVMGMPNPAAYNCIHIGGKLKNGVCSISEWTLFHLFHQKNVSETEEE